MLGIEGITRLHGPVRSPVKVRGLPLGKPAGTGAEDEAHPGGPVLRQGVLEGGEQVLNAQPSDLQLTAGVRLKVRRKAGQGIWNNAARNLERNRKGARPEPTTPLSEPLEDLGGGTAQPVARRIRGDPNRHRSNTDSRNWSVRPARSSLGPRLASGFPPGVALVHTPRVLNPFPITAHALVPRDVPDRVVKLRQSMDAAWSRARLRWGSGRVSIVVVAEDAVEMGSTALLGGLDERAPVLATVGDRAVGRKAMTWAHRALRERRFDAVMLLAAPDEGAASMLLLERQGDSLCELLGVVPQDARGGATAGLSEPDWIVQDPLNERAAAFFGTQGQPRRVSLASPRSLVLKVACVADLLDRGVWPEGDIALDAPAPLSWFLDAELVWVLDTPDSEGTAWIAPIRCRT